MFLKPIDDLENISVVLSMQRRNKGSGMNVEKFELKELKTLTQTSKEKGNRFMVKYFTVVGL